MTYAQLRQVCKEEGIPPSKKAEALSRQIRLFRGKKGRRRSRLRRALHPKSFRGLNRTIEKMIPTIFENYSEGCADVALIRHLETTGH